MAAPVGSPISVFTRSTHCDGCAPPPRWPRAARLLGRRQGSLDVGGAALLDWAGTPTTVHAGWTGRPGCICTWRAREVRPPSTAAEIVEGITSIATPGG